MREHVYDDWSNAMDYVGTYHYPFVNPSAPDYIKQEALDRIAMELQFATDTMGATPALLMQSFGGVATEPTGPRYPTDAEIADWNCSVRSQFASYTTMPLSWYVWNQGFYTDELVDHQTQTPRTFAAWCT